MATVVTKKISINKSNIENYCEAQNVSFNVSDHAWRKWLNGNRHGYVILKPAGKNEIYPTDTAHPFKADSLISASRSAGTCKVDLQFAGTKVHEESFTTTTQQEKSKTNNKETKNEINTLESFTGVVTAYSPYCTGCIGITASGYNVKNTIYYKDKEYGKLRVLAADKKYKFGSIIKLSNIDNYNEIYGIVLDRGSAIGNNKKSQIDLLFAKEHECVTFGRKHNVKIEVLRYGF